MYFKYLAGLVLFGFAFRFLLAVVAIPLVLLQMLFQRRSQDQLQLLTVGANQVIVSALYSAFLAVITGMYASEEGVQHSWVYALTGFLFVFVALSANAADKARHAEGVPPWQGEELEAASLGAGIGFLVGLASFPITYHWPEVVIFVPGAATFFGWCFNLGVWLTRFWIVNAVLLMVVVGYVVNAGFMAIFGGVMLAYALWSGLGPLLRRTKGVSTSPREGRPESSEQAALERLEREAEASVEAGSFAEAVGLFKEVIRQDPTRLHVYEHLMETYAKAGRDSDAAAQYRALVEFYEKRSSAQEVTRLAEKAAALGLAIE